MKPQPTTTRLTIYTRAITALALVFLQACMESRTFEMKRADGTTLTYKRTSLGVKSLSEGVSISKAGEDMTVDVGATGSQSDAEIAIEAFGIGLMRGGQNQDK